MHSDTYQQLEVVLDREFAAVRALATTLDGERVALTGTAPAAVVHHAAEKTRLFAIIEHLENERRVLCDTARISLPARQGGRTPLVEGVSATIGDRWRAVLEMIAGCRIANEVNGYIINCRRGQVTQLLQALRGTAPVTYGPQGRTMAKSLRPLAWA